MADPVAAAALTILQCFPMSTARKPIGPESKPRSAKTSCPRSRNYQPIEMPLEHADRGSSVAFFTSLCGFAVIWYIWWLAILGLIGAFAIFVWYAWRDEHEHIIPVEEVQRLERTRAAAHSTWNIFTN